MKLKLAEKNPFKNTIRLGQAFSWELFSKLSSEGKTIVALDYGAYNGKMLEQFAKDGIVGTAISVDLNKDIVDEYKYKLHPNHQLIHIKKGEPLPFEENHFDVVTMIGVFEHVYDQLTLLNEIKRILKDQGRFIIAVPGKHFFSFLDLGNWKFIFPRIHKWYVTLRFGKNYYVRHFVECANGLIGDVEVEKKWHQHFTHSELSELLNKAGFIVSNKDGFGFFFRLFHNIALLLPFLKPFFHKLILWDARKFSVAEIFVEAKKAKL